jgi:hypothetical protein
MSCCDEKAVSDQRSSAFVRPNIILQKNNKYSDSHTDNVISQILVKWKMKFVRPNIFL